MTTGERIKQRRKELGISADVLAERIGVSRSIIFRYENGSIQKLPLPLLAPIAQALSVDVYSLVDFETASELLSASINEKMMHLDPKEQVLLLAFSQLNDAGQDVAIERVNELAELPKYKNAPPEGEA